LKKKIQKIGYSRSSPGNRSAKGLAQLGRLEKFGCDSIYREIISRHREYKPELSKAIKAILPGGMLVVSSGDRAAGSYTQLKKIILSVLERKGKFVVTGYDDNPIIFESEREIPEKIASVMARHCDIHFIYDFKSGELDVEHTEPCNW
jgi:hypothetical protein